MEGNGPFDPVDEASEESFPASDAPARTVVTGIQDVAVPPAPPGEVAIENNEAAHRFEARFPEGIAELRYRYDGGSTMVLVHTEVPRVLRHQGIATRLAASALAFARDHRFEVVPQCPFVAAYITRHQEFASLIRAGIRAGTAAGPAPAAHRDDAGDAAERRHSPEKEGPHR
jgi:predicted GNAT family acetyltransferase